MMRECNTRLFIAACAGALQQLQFVWGEMYCADSTVASAAQAAPLAADQTMPADTLPVAGTAGNSDSMSSLPPALQTGAAAAQQQQQGQQQGHWQQEDTQPQPQQQQQQTLTVDDTARDTCTDRMSGAVSALGTVRPGARLTDHTPLLLYGPLQTVSLYYGSSAPSSNSTAGAAAAAAGRSCLRGIKVAHGGGPSSPALVGMLGSSGGGAREASLRLAEGEAVVQVQYRMAGCVQQLRCAVLCCAVLCCAVLCCAAAN
jgi:hypothetical protein